MKKRVEQHENQLKNAISNAGSIFIFIVMLMLPHFCYAQEKKVTLNIENVSIEEVLKEIQKQTGLNYLFNHEELQNEALVSIHAYNESVEQVLKQCLKNTKLTYEIVDGVIIIKPQKKIQITSLSQVIRGKVVNTETRIPLSFASVAIVTANPPMGTVTDSNGNFRIEKVPIGRHDIQVSFVGYETKIIPEIIVTSAKEIVLTVEMREQISKVDEVVVKAYTKKDKPLNSMATLSARTFSVEEAQRYAAGFDDPSRLASSFAGVTSGNISGNEIIIRGNAPKGLLWRLEGIEISNPNHLPGFTSLGGGALSAISSLMLSNSDFFTGAFPAEYGNAMSGVFDFKLRSGNNENHEHAIRIGTMGTDISSEGPFSKKDKASYLFNYRYSTLALIKDILPEEIAPSYQDLCFKINIPTKKRGVFSVWALATADNFEYEAKKDTSEWSTLDDQESFKTNFKTGALGLNHRYIFGEKTYLNSTAAIASNYTRWDEWYTDYSYNQQKMQHIDMTDYKITYTSVLNHKFNTKHTNRTGIIINRFNYNSFIQYAPAMGDELITMVQEDGSSWLYSFFSHFKLVLAPKLILNAGIHSQYFNLNDEFLIEPRIGLTFNATDKQSLSIAYGNHSRLEPQFIYFTKVMDEDIATYPNKDLKITKAHHLVLAYDLSINPNLRLKIEPYFQYLYDVPVIPDSSFSTLNMQTNSFFTDQLTNDGTGTNIGIDVTLERFLKNGYYYLITGSLFDSKYIAGDNIKRNTRYNSNIAFNLLFGKEWMLGAERNKILSINGRLNMIGGTWDTPVINDYPYQKGDEVMYDYSKTFSNRLPNKYYLNASINYRINKKKHTSIWSVHALNILNMAENYGYLYNYKEDKVEELKYNVIFPYLSYKIEF